MQPVRRKKKRGFRSGYLLLLPLSAAAILLIWRFYPAAVIPPSKPDPIVLFQTSKESITALTVHPLKENAYTVVRGKSGEYLLKGETDYPLNQSQCDEMFDIMASVVASEKVTTLGKEAPLKDFGMDENALSVTVYSGEKKMGTWMFGSELKTEVPERFMYQEGSDIIYLTHIDYPDVLNFTQKELHVVPAVNFTKDIIGGIDVEVNNAEPLKLTRENGLWKLTSLAEYPANPAKVEQLLQKIAGMRLAVFECRATPENLKKYGLDAPEARLILHIDPSVIRSRDDKTSSESVQNVPAHKIVFDIGRAANPVSFYCLYRDTVYKASRLSMGFITEQRSEHFLLERPFNISINAVKSLTVCSPGKDAVQYTVDYVEQIDKNNALIMDDNGRQIFDLVVQKNGAPFLTNQWTAFYSTLSSLTVSGRVPTDFIAHGEPLYTVTLEFDSGRDKIHRRTVTFYPYDALHAAVSIDGTTVHYIEREKLNVLTQ